MADEKSIYERWSEERLDPPFPKEWGLDEEDEAELLWPIWPLLFMGESDTEESSHDRTSPAAVPAHPQRFGMRSTIAVNGRDTSTSTSRTLKASLRAAEPTLASVPSSLTPGTKKNGIP